MIPPQVHYFNVFLHSIKPPSKMCYFLGKNRLPQRFPAVFDHHPGIIRDLNNNVPSRCRKVIDIRPEVQPWHDLAEI